MKKILLLLAIFAIIFNQAPCLALTVPSGETIPVTFKHSVNSSDVRAGDVISLIVDENVIIGGTLAFKAGSTGVAYVEKAKGGGAWGRAGYIHIATAEINDVNGEKHTCALSVNKKGEGKSSGIILPIIGAIILWPLIFFAFKKGDPAVVNPGQVLYAITGSHQESES